MGLIFWQLVFSAILLLFVTGARGKRPALGPRYLRHYLAIGLLGTLLPNSFSYLCIAELPAGVVRRSSAVARSEARSQPASCASRDGGPTGLCPSTGSPSTGG